jgi:hypothetical protein
MREVVGSSPTATTNPQYCKELSPTLILGQDVWLNRFLPELPHYQSESGGRTESSSIAYDPAFGSHFAVSRILERRR